MADRSAILYRGENMAPTYDYTDYVVWEESEFGTRAYLGEGNTSTVVIRDPLGEQGSVQGLPGGLTGKILSSKNLFVIRVGSDFLFRGRVGIKNYSRDDQRVERYRQVECLLHDTNWDLDHITVHNWSRPAETDKARVQGLIASFMSGSPRPTTNINGSNLISASNLHHLEAHTYTRDSTLGVIRDVAESANKQFFLTGDSLTGGSLFYDGNDSTAYACTLSISDRPNEVNYTTVFPPIWNVGPASTEDGAEQVDEIYLFYGTGDDKYVTAHDLTTHTEYGHSSVILTDDSTESPGAAQGRANAILSHRQYEDKTYNVTIGPLTDAQVVLIEHGQLISIKARAIPDADDVARTMRITQCRFTTPVPGTWFAHLQLGRPWKLGAYNQGSPGTQAQREMATGSGTPYTCVPNETLVSDETTVNLPNADDYNGFWEGALGAPTWNDDVSQMNGGYDDETFSGGNRLVRREFCSITKPVGATHARLTGDLEWMASGTGTDTLSIDYELYAGNWGVSNTGNPPAFGHTGGPQLQVGTIAPSSSVPINVTWNIEDVSRAQWVFHCLTARPSGANQTGVYFDNWTLEFLSGVCDPPSTGQEIAGYPLGMGDGTTTEFSLPGPFVERTLRVFVDGILQIPVSIDAAAGTFDLGWAPTSEETIHVDWRAA